MEEFHQINYKSVETKRSLKNQQNSSPSGYEVFKNNSNQQNMSRQYKRIGSVQKVSAYTKKIQYQRKPTQSQHQPHSSKCKRIGTLKKIMAIIYEDAKDKSKMNGHQCKNEKSNRLFSVKEEFFPVQEKQQKKQQIMEKKAELLEKSIQSSRLIEQKQPQQPEERTAPRKETTNSDSFTVNCLLYLPQINDLMLRVSQQLEDIDEEKKSTDRKASLKAQTCPQGEVSHKTFKSLDESKGQKKEKNKMADYSMKKNLQAKKHSTLKKKNMQISFQKATNLGFKGKQYESKNRQSMKAKTRKLENSSLHSFIMEAKKEVSYLK